MYVIAIKIIYLVTSYLLGSCLFAKIIPSILNINIDLSAKGSKNLGATNAVRILGKKIGFFVFLFDFIKGFLPVIFAKFMLDDIQIYGVELAFYSLLATVIGHILPFSNSFRGGKGVAVSFGGLLALNHELFLITSVSWILIFLLTRISFICSIFSFAILLLASVGTNYLFLSLVLFLIILMTHRMNIRFFFTNADL